MNFDTYLETHQPNSRRTAMLTVAAVLALSGTTLLLSAGWIAGKLQIARVDPPTVEYILLSLNVDEPMPPPPPPPPPPGSDDADEEEADDDDEVPDDPELLDDPDEVPESIPKVKASAGHPAGQVGGIPGGKPGGILGGNPASTMIPKGPAIAVAPPTNAPPAIKRPLSTVMASAVYSPEPSQKRLAMTKAARFDKRNGKNTTSFCISTSGRVEKVRTKSKFPGDPQVDQIIRETISSWRFRPLEVGGKRVRVCTERTFLIKFQ